MWPARSMTSEASEGELDGERARSALAPASLASFPASPEGLSSRSVVSGEQEKSLVIRDELFPVEGGGVALRCR